MTRILWVSRHIMTGPQLADLKRIYGQNLKLTQYDATISDVTVLVPYIAASDVIAVVLPLEKVAELLPLTEGRPVIQAVSGRVKREKPQNAAAEEDAGQNQETDYEFVHQYWQQLEHLQISLRRL